MTTTTPTKKPTILVLEGLSGSSRCVAAAGAEVLKASPYMVYDVIDTVEHGKYDGLLLTGGGDVNPSMYGAKPRKEVYGVDDDRDYAEQYALQAARDLQIPVLGICRGAQIMAVEAGGKLWQHIPNHSGRFHGVEVREGSTLHKACGTTNPTVKSLHHQEIRSVPKGWRISGKAPDGVAEAIESADGRCLGVQFHPEMTQQDAYARSIFRWLAVEAGERAGIPMPPQQQGKSKAQRRRERRERNRALGTGTERSTYGALITYYCPFDGIRFDKRDDQKDHLWFVHNMIVGPDGRIVPINRHTGNATALQSLMGAFPGATLYGTEQDA